MRVLLTAMLTACVAAADPAPPPAPQPGDAIEAMVKQRVDAYRARVGLPPVTLDARLSRGCREHAEYMRLNRGTDAVAGLNAHTQRPKLPGATLAGAACGKAADLFAGVQDLGVAVDAWMSGLYHRRPILTPSLEKIGVGYAQLDDGTYMAALMFQDNKAADVAGKWPVTYPADQQRDVPLEFGSEVPNPVPGGGRAGYPITLQFPPFDKVTDVRARLVDAKGAAVPAHASDPEHPATAFGQYGVVCLIPQTPLAPSATYTVAIEATWKGTERTWRWSFTTLALRAVDAHDEGAVAAALNVPSVVRGKVIQGGLVDEETAYLQIGLRAMTRFKMVSVLIPRAIWKELGGKPERFVGKVVEAEGTPHLVQGVYVNVPIAVGRQFRVK
jgi:uncharacterized protein YkwD